MSPNNVGSYTYKVSTAQLLKQELSNDDTMPKWIGKSPDDLYPIQMRKVARRRRNLPQGRATYLSSGKIPALKTYSQVTLYGPNRLYIPKYTYTHAIKIIEKRETIDLKKSVEGFCRGFGGREKLLL